MYVDMPTLASFGTTWINESKKTGRRKKTYKGTNLTI